MFFYNNNNNFSQNTLFRYSVTLIKKQNCGSRKHIDLSSSVSLMRIILALQHIDIFIFGANTRRGERNNKTLNE